MALLEDCAFPDVAAETRLSPQAALHEPTEHTAASPA